MNAEPESTAAPVAADAESSRAVAGAPRGPGARLSAARTGRGLSVQQAVDALHVDRRFIEALEADRYEAFDAPVYARGFLRKYGAWLELPADELLQAYAALHVGPVDPVFVPVASAERPARDWTAWRRIGLAVLALGAVGGSYWWWLGAAPAVRDHVPATNDTPAATDAGPSAILRSAALANQAVPTGIAAATSATAIESPAAASPGGAGTLTLRFVGECWVEVYAADGRRLAFDLYGPADAPAFDGPGPWRVVLGSADSARVAIGGRPVAIPAAARHGTLARFEVARDGTARVPAS